MKKGISIILTLIIILILLIGVNELPTFGKENNPSNNYVAHKYIENSIEDTGGLNIVTGIILDYRAFDTFGEATVLFTGIIVVLIVLKKS
ncbi:hydrogen gas-evolving membrane-bound hydrogenase subunit E [Maledivibacter halophilus]|uniref:Multicomponent Na+:H+ antiporter subunit B n=1 Tax=Maledivibacter halophilus TaxID=36842 RepID=A0A1T5MLL1_9FIRM|nr:hydrogen gas-evolving membrane-bound hydrogenase subunit E [Maledivibacter halophilus]SKC88943.1 multicomponent Na+:H+ antiporter subunit B [Maledivibacter halophilus]